MHWIKRLLSRRSTTEQAVAARLHAAITTEARQPSLFGGAGIPDTLDGRAAAIAVFHGVVSARLVAAGPKGRAVAERLAGNIFDSFDAALRETGVGDASIARKIRKLGEHFTGIGVAVANALAETEPKEPLREVLLRNEVCRTGGTAPVLESALQAHAALMRQTDEQILAGDTGWASQQNAV